MAEAKRTFDESHSVRKWGTAARLSLSQLRKMLLLRQGHDELLRKSQGAWSDGGRRNDRAPVVTREKVHSANRLSPEQCALVETLAIGCHAVNRGNAMAG